MRYLKYYIVVHITKVCKNKEIQMLSTIDYIKVIKGVEIQHDYNPAFSSLNPDKQHTNLTKFATSTDNFIHQHGVDVLNRQEVYGGMNILQSAADYECHLFVGCLLEKGKQNEFPIFYAGPYWFVDMM